MVLSCSFQAHFNIPEPVPHQHTALGKYHRSALGHPFHWYFNFLKLFDSVLSVTPAHEAWLTCPDQSVCGR